MFSWSEYSVAIVFIIMIVLWITREFGETKGWDILFEEGYDEREFYYTFTSVALSLQ